MTTLLAPRPDTVDDISRREVIIGAAAAGLLAACGSDPTAETAAPGSDHVGDFPRSVEHAMGTTVIPSRPERVVVLDTGELDSALAVGVTPVGAVTTEVDDKFLSYLEEDAAGIEVVGTIPAPNLEAIAALRPDLILSNKVRHEELYDELSQIAPTVFAEQIGAVWKDNLRLAAKAMGRTDEAEAAIDAYQAEAADLGDAIGDPSSTSVAAVRFVEGTIRVYREESFIGTVLADIGLDQVNLPLAEFPAFTEISREQLERIDPAEAIVYSSFGQADDSGELEVLAGPLWANLAAVQADRATRVDDDVFFSGIGLRAAQLIVAELERFLTGAG